jgi:hypothetical protein
VKNERESTLAWEYVSEKKPLLPPGEYEGIVRSWRRGKSFGRDEIVVEVELLSQPLGSSADYDSPVGLVLETHFNVPIVRGVARLGAGSKFVRALFAVFEGHPPATPNPDCLMGRQVRCLIATVKHDSNKTLLPRSCWYSTIVTFLGPGVGGPGSASEEEPLF